MEKSEEFQTKEIGAPGYLNKNCLLPKALNYAPYKRCQYCESEFHNCLFLRYQIISLILIILFITVSFLIEGEFSELAIISVFILVIVYGYFFNKSSDKLIEANFAERKAKKSLEELTKRLKQKVNEQTKEIKSAYEKLKKAYEGLKLLDKAKSEFISIASHQLRTPLTVIKGYISMILENNYGKMPQEVQKPLENIYTSNERLLKLVNDLLNISRIESGKIEIKKTKTSIKTLISSIIEELKPATVKKGINLIFEKPKKALPEIFIDKFKIRQVIMNLIDNAIRYTKKGEIRIKIKVSDSKILISVTDTGEGISKEEISYLFESFSRGKTGTMFWTEGAGLGLYIAKKFIDMHNGKIWAESQGKSKGSTFNIELPIKSK